MADSSSSCVYEKYLIEVRKSSKFLNTNTDSLLLIKVLAIPKHANNSVRHEIILVLISTLRMYASEECEK